MLSERTEEVAEQWKEWLREVGFRAQRDEGRGLSSARIFTTLSRMVPADAVVTVDVGNHAYSFGRYFHSRRQRVVLSGYLGAIGFGYPAALGAWAAFPDRPIFCVTGDGGFTQYMGEVMTAVHHGIPVKHILLNNGELGKIRQEQELERWPVWATELTNVGFASYARSCGALGIRVQETAELEDALAELVGYDGPGTVEIVSDGRLV